MPLNLHFYLEQFPSVCESKFGRRYDLQDLEKRLAVLRDEKHLLSARDVARIFNPDATPYAKYWPRPHIKVLEESLKQHRLKLGPLPAQPDGLVKRMLGVFQNLGTVSLILQFVYPERFAIFSTPIIHLVHITRQNLVDLYIAYCDELRVWSDHFRMTTVAATSNALWAYSEMTKETSEDRRATTARSEFDNDIWIQRRIVSHTLRPFLKRYGELQLAYILSEENPRLAGKIAAEEYERLLNLASERMYGKQLRREKGAAGQLLSDLAARGVIDLPLVAELQLVWEIRNRAVHPDSRPLTPEEVERMVETVERVCVPWSKTKERFKHVT